MDDQELTQLEIPGRWMQQESGASQYQFTSARLRDLDDVSPQSIACRCGLTAGEACWSRGLSTEEEGYRSVAEGVVHLDIGKYCAHELLKSVRVFSFWASTTTTSAGEGLSNCGRGVMAANQAGQNVQGWILDRVVGSGSFATVWKAHKRIGDEECYAAVKVIATKKLNPKLKQSLECEVSILKRIRHSNVVKLYEAVKVQLQT